MATMTMGHILKWLKVGKPKTPEVFLKETGRSAGCASRVDTDPAASLWRHTSIWIFTGTEEPQGDPELMGTMTYKRPKAYGAACPMLPQLESVI